MDVKVKTFTLSCICEGCLSTDRELIEITESHIKEVFYELILNEAGNQKKLLLCWECKGNIQRFLVFKQQVKDAHNTLNQYMRPLSLRALLAS